MTRVLAQEPAERGITVNAVVPGPIQTQLFLQKAEEKVRQLAE